jgi:hypothetical protein
MHRDSADAWEHGGGFDPRGDTTDLRASVRAFRRHRGLASTGCWSISFYVNGRRGVNGISDLHAKLRFEPAD